MIAILACAAVVMAMLPRTYTATTTLMVNYEVNDPLNGKDLPVGQMNNYIATQVELMRTPELLSAVVDRLDLTRNEDYARGYSGASGTLSEWVAAIVHKNLAIYQGQFGSQLIYITYSATEPELAAQVANTVADVYKEQDYLRSTGPPSERAERYALQLQELKDKVDQAQLAVTDFHLRKRLVDGGNRANVDVVLLATLEGRLLEAQTARRLAEARAAGDQSVSDQVLASTEVQALKTQLATQELRLAHLNTVYTDKHPEVREFQAQIDTTRRSLATALRSYSANASAELYSARRLEQSLQQAVAEQRAKVLVTGQQHDEAAKFALELDSAKAVYKRALDGYDQIMFASAGHYSNVALVSRATPPVKPSKPRMLSRMVAAVFVAGFLGFAIPLVYELFNRRVRCRDDLERHHGVAVLMEFGRLPLRSAI